MARMYPDPINPETKSNAERRLYAAFRDELGDDYTVFHSVAWQSLDKHRRARDGETDFVIAHPQRGILVLETKGGATCYDPGTGKWTSTDSDGQAHIISDPFGQAKDSKYILRGQLKVMLNMPLRQICVGHAVAFPDVVVGPEWLGPDKPREIILDATDLADLSSWVNRVLAYWHGQENQCDATLGKRSMQALVELLGRAWELRPALWGQFVQEQRQLLRLTEQQYQILDVLNRQRQALICGCAGSGKTMLAVEKATRLARQGFHVLLTCFNKNLAADLRLRLQFSTNLDILHFHGLCYKLAQCAGVLPLEQGDHDAFFSHQLPEAMLQARNALEIRYDAVIVDEGQDFQEHWWVPLRKLLHDEENGIFYVFFDDNQRLYVQRSAFPIAQEPYCLTVNCRNTQRIHQVVAQFYEGADRPKALGPEGRPVELVFYSGQRLWPALTTVLHRLNREEKVPPEEIAVLSPLSQTSRLWADAAFGRALLSDVWPPSPGRVYFGSIYSFKGLERSVIILVEMESWHQDLVPLLYVGCSRAHNHLIVLLPKDAGPEVREAFAVAGMQLR